MRLIGMMPVRNEDWVLDLSARAALMWCDALIIFDHASTDETPAIIEQLYNGYGNRVISFSEYDPLWREMEHRQAMLEVARSNQATHVAIIDADEILTGNLISWIRPAIEALPRGSVLQLPGYNLRCSLDQYHANGIWGERWFSVAFADDPRLGWSGDKFHQREPAGLALRQVKPISQGRGGVMHLWGASERRLRAKHAAYKMTETLRWPAKPHAEIDRLYNLAFVAAAAPAYDQNWRYAATPEEWWKPYSDVRSCVQLDRDPWQEEMCRNLFAQYGPARFSELDLFGVCDAVAQLAQGVAQ